MLKFERAYSIPVSLMYAQQARFLYQAGKHSNADGDSSPRSKQEVGTLDLNNRDFHLMFLESYGTTVFDNKIYFQRVENGLHHLAKVAQKHSWHVSTGVYEAPTFGGASWLSHATIMTGQWVASNAHYRRLLTTDADTLTGWFRNSGYRVVALLPGLKQQWPEGKFYNYERIWDAQSLSYPGPPFGWWEIPDQYSLAYFHTREDQFDGPAPLFTFFATISSHMPFHPVPPIEANWANLLSVQPYATHQAINTSNGVYGDDLQFSYTDAIVYNFYLVADLLRLTSDQHPLIIVLGDHQPPAVISGADAPWTIPVHVFSQDPQILERFKSVGFVDGLIPKNNLGRLASLHNLLLIQCTTEQQPDCDG